MTGKLGAPEDFYRHHALTTGQVQFDALRKARQVGDDQQLLVLELADERQHLAIAGIEKLQRAAAESLETACAAGSAAW